MTKQVINVGTSANDRKGDSLRAAFQKVNANFTELYTGLEGTGIDLSAVDQHVVPATDSTYDLGSSTKQWRSLYVSTDTIYIDNVPITVSNNTLVVGDVNNRVTLATIDDVTNAVGAVVIPDVSNFITAEAIPFVPTDVADLTDTTNLLDSGTAVLSVDIASTTYKGFIARYGRVYDNSGSTELTVSKIVIFRESAYIGSGSTIHPTSSEDDFAVTGLGPSDVVAMFVLYGDTNGAKSLETLTQFVEVAVDTVLLTGGVEGENNTIEAMQAAFYTNINTLTAAAGGLVADFDFYQTYINATTGTTTVREGSGAEFTITSSQETYVIDFIDNGGTNYLVGHKILILGSALTGFDVTNDAIITVTEVNNGAITAATISGTAVELLLLNFVSGTSYQSGNGFVVAGVGENQDTTLYANLISQGTGYVVGDVLTLPGSDLQGGVSPDNDITITVTSVGNLGEIGNWNVTGTFPNVWPANSIDDGGNDQYDTANFINTDLANQISYNGGVIVDDAELQFGPGSKYVVAYESSVFGIFATGSSATTISTSGNSGADGSSTTDTGPLQRPGLTQLNAVTELAIVEGALTFPDGTEQTTAFSRVKSTATGGRIIEEVTGYKAVAVTARTNNIYAGTLARTTDINYEIFVTRTFELQEVIAPIWNGDVTAQFEISLDGGATYVPAFLVSLPETEIWFSTNSNVPVPQVAGDAVSIRIITGATPVIWWDSADLPSSSDNFRGAIIDYHAYTGEATIIGTIHIVDDDGEENITHTEVSSGSTDSENDDLWLVQNEGTISYRRIDGESKTLKVHWTAKVFYGNETYD